RGVGGSENQVGKVGRMIGGGKRRRARNLRARVQGSAAAFDRDVPRAGPDHAAVKGGRAVVDEDERFLLLARAAIRSDVDTSAVFELPALKRERRFGHLA